LGSPSVDTSSESSSSLVSSIVSPPNINLPILEVLEAREANPDVRLIYLLRN
jgi:hypothetical protein